MGTFVTDKKKYIWQGIMLSRLVSRCAISTANKSPLMMSHSIRSFAGEKGEDRVETRMDGLMMTDEEVEVELAKQFDEEGSYKPPHMDHFVSMTRRDVMMNVRIPPLGIEPPPFSEEHFKEITEKTSLTRDNIEWARSHWADDSIKPDQKQHMKIATDMLEMYKKGVSFATINLWIDYYSGADVGSPNAIYNKSWARIDS